MNKSRDDAFNQAIESAVERGTNKPVQGQSSVGERHQKVDQALRQRLQQLRTAMGDDSQQAEKPALAPPPESPPPSGPIPMPALYTRVTEPLRPGAASSSRWVFWSLSALLLGGAVWYALNRGHANTTASTPPARLAEATPPATPTTPSPPIEMIAEPLIASAAAPTEAASPITAALSPSPAEQPVSASAQTASTVVAAPAASAPPDPSEQLRGLIESWRQAWSNRDTESYLSFYGSVFEPGNGLSLSQWKASRYRNVGGKTDIKVHINDLQVTSLDDRQARITFLQDYTSGNYKESAQPKTLIVAREGDAWRIVKEWQGDASY
jgi:ketosteroid isomerase-like protein